MIGNGIIAKLQILQLEADVALQWGAALTAAAREHHIDHPLSQSMWISTILADTHGLTIIDPPIRSVADIYAHAQDWAWRWQQGWRGVESPQLQSWHKRVTNALGLG